MFFMIGITDGRKDFSFTQTVLCQRCGRYGRYQVFMTYVSLLLFFIPCFRFNKRYYVETSCCHTLYELDPEVGRRIAKGESVTISESDLTPVSTGYGGQASHRTRCCRNCGFMTVEDYDFCPKCGNPLS